MSKIRFLLIWLLALGTAYAQTALDSTTLNEAVDSSEDKITVTSASAAAVGEIAVVDREAMLITAVDTTNNILTVQRGWGGTLGDDHANGRLIYINPANRYIQRELAGSCTAGSEFPNFTPLISLPSGNRYVCTNSRWVLQHWQEFTFHDSEARDYLLTFDGNDADFSFGIDDSADDFVIVTGTALGTDNLVAFPEIGTTTSGQRAIFYGENPATAADNDESYISFFGETDGGQAEVGRLTWRLLDVSAADDDSQIQFDAFVNNTLMQVFAVGSQSNTGTAVQATLGDGGAEDTQIVFDGNAIDVHLGLDDSGDNVVLGLGTALGTTPWLTFTQAGAIVFEGDTDDAFEATVSVDDPAADYNLTLGEFTVTKAFGPTVADHTSANSKFFIATRKYRVVDIDMVWVTAETTGAMDAMVERLQGTETCGNGDDLQSAVVDATGTAETVASPALTATTANLSLAAGDRLCVTLTATPNEITGLTVSVRLVPE